MGLPTFAFDAREKIWFIGFANLRLETRAEIDAAFEACGAFWRKHCVGQKPYAVVDYTNFHIAIAHAEYYAASVKRASEQFTSGVVRYGANAVDTRAVVRGVGIKNHVAANLYATREDALAVARGLRDGTVVQLAAAPRP